MAPWPEKEVGWPEYGNFSLPLRKINIIIISGFDITISRCLSSLMYSFFMVVQFSGSAITSKEYFCLLLKSAQNR